jgi:hypothetical protein
LFLDQKFKIYKVGGGSNFLKGGDIPRIFSPRGDIPRNIAPLLTGVANPLGRGEGRKSCDTGIMIARDI